jgi:hypothetical protein
MNLTRFQAPLNEPHDDDWYDRRDAELENRVQDEPRQMPTEFLTVKIVKPTNPKQD